MAVSLGKRIMKIRRALGESRQTFGDRFMRSRRTVENWEQDRFVPEPLVKRLILALEQK